MMRTRGLSCALVLSAILVACSWGGSQSNGADAASGAHCGDGICEASEIDSCPADCGSGSGSGTTTSVCNHDGVCQAADGETAANCPSDCGSTGSDQGSDQGSGSDDCSSAQVQSDCEMCLETVGSDCGTTGLTNCLACIGL